MKDTIKNIEIWAENKSLIKKENSYKQFAKLVEEVAEVGTALNNNDIEELKDGVGDCAIVLIILSLQNGLNFEDCLKSAYEVIKNRTGKTVGGVFVKDKPEIGCPFDEEFK